jgi:phage terminase large subunit-like protein
VTRFSAWPRQQAPLTNNPAARGEFRRRKNIAALKEQGKKAAGSYRCLQNAPAERGERQIEPKEPMMRYLLLWILGVPIPVLILIWLLWGH